MLCVFDYGLSTDNVIYYNHTNTLSFNWRDYGEKITQEEFDDFVNNEVVYLVKIILEEMEGKDHGESS